MEGLLRPASRLSNHQTDDTLPTSTAPHQHALQLLGPVGGNRVLEAVLGQQSLTLAVHESSLEIISAVVSPPRS